MHHPRQDNYELCDSWTVCSRIELKPDEDQCMLKSVRSFKKYPAQFCYCIKKILRLICISMRRNRIKDLLWAVKLPSNKSVLSS